MPEGDSIHKLAHQLRPELSGIVVSNLTIDGHRCEDFRGIEIDEVWPVGKHLFISAGDIAIRSHLGMHGTWHRYFAGDRWQLPRTQANLVLSTLDDGDGDACDWILFRAKEVEIVDLNGAKHRAFLRRLGPDLLGDRGDEILREALARARERDPETPLADVLLDQSVAAGIGNVWKSELCFLENTNPTRPLSEVDDALLERIYARARDMLARNLGPAMRSTRGPSPHAAHDSRPRAIEDARYWVYGQAGTPCAACGHTIEYSRTGRPPRATYWCPRCQPA